MFQLRFSSFKNFLRNSYNTFLRNLIHLKKRTANKPDFQSIFFTISKRFYKNQRLIFLVILQPLFVCVMLFAFGVFEYFGIEIRDFSSTRQMYKQKLIAIFKGNSFPTIFWSLIFHGIFSAILRYSPNISDFFCFTPFSDYCLHIVKPILSAPKAFKVLTPPNIPEAFAQ